MESFEQLASFMRATRLYLGEPDTGVVVTNNGEEVVQKVKSRYKPRKNTLGNKQKVKSMRDRWVPVKLSSIYKGL